MRSIQTALVISVLALAAAPAFADDYDYDGDGDGDGSGLLGVAGGLTLSVGGGVSAFAEGNQRDFMGTAGTWDARVAFGTASPIAFEAAYIGSAQNIDRLGLDSDAVLLSNGAEAVARLNLLPGPVTPYVWGGAAWRRYSIVNSNRNASDLLDEDDVFEVPLGIGADFHLAGFVIDGRANYRIAFDDDLTRTNDLDDIDADEEEDMHTFGARVAVGVMF